MDQRQDNSVVMNKTVMSAYWSSCRLCLTESVYKVVLRKSISAQIRQLILFISDNKGSVDGFERELTFTKRFHKYCL